MDRKMKTPQTTTFGIYPKKITCQCNAVELPEDVITVTMNERCRVCNHPFQVSVPKSAIKGLVLHHAA
jgi:hypothetical protein